MAKSKLQKILEQKGINGYKLAEMRQKSPQSTYRLIREGISSAKKASSIARLLNVDPIFLIELSTIAVDKKEDEKK